MSERLRAGAERPFPDVPTSFLITIGAILAGGIVGVLFLDLGLFAAEGLGTALGVGGVATLAARRVAEPQAARIGLTPLDWRVLPLILCLTPAILLASELDNFAYDWSPAAAEEPTTADAGPVAAKTTEPGSGTPGSTAPAPASASPSTPETKTEPGVASDAASQVTRTDAADTSDTADAADAADAAGASGASDASDARQDPSAKADAKKAKDTNDETLEPNLDPDDPFSLVQGLIVTVGIAPVIHEFLFRGVLQQGLVAQLGFSRGITLTALLWTMLRPVPSTSPARFAAAFASWLAMGWLLGMVRIASGSILGTILLTSLWAALSFTSIALIGRVELPGMNVDGTHLPAAITVASLLIVGWAGSRVYEIAKRGAAGGAGVPVE